MSPANCSISWSGKGGGVRSFICCLALAACFFLNGCGYHLASGGGTSSLIAGKTVTIPMWRNKSYRPNLEAVLTGSLINEFALRSGGMVVAEETADLTLTGTIVSYVTTAVSYTAADQIREYRATMTVDAALAERKSQKVLWKGRLSASQDYPTTANSIPQHIALQQNSEEAALREISRRLAQQLYQKMTENF
jgi:outer membrane lipopolysaccharide assembly protein LptE/RlpB